jgi:hypothetical protein
VVRPPVPVLLGLLLAGTFACGADSGYPYSPTDDGGHAGARGEAGALAFELCAGRWPGLGGGPPGLVDCRGGDGIRLCGAPMVFRPTDHGFSVSVVLASGDPSQLVAAARPSGAPAWQAAFSAELVAPDAAQWTFDGLAPGTRYEYEIQLPVAAGPAQALYSGSAVTQRQAGDAFVFALMSDSHIGPTSNFNNQGDWCTLASVSRALGAASPDFVLNLGDMLDFHEFGFNEPPLDRGDTETAYANYRVLLGDTLGRAAHFPVIGNWEGEDGWYTPEELSLSRQARLAYMPGPLPTTYPQSGSAAQDYYAFTWGDALFVVLNVMSYTRSPHLLSTGVGAPDDWTLGPEQLDWLTRTLASAQSKWRFLFIHHPVGGNAGDPENSAYGRGGGRAAYVGEQARVHQLMLEHGVQVFFYGHDHVFTDMTVDGIHYSEPGNAGAIWTFSSSLTGYERSWLESGWARVAVSPDAVEVRFLSMAGELLYQYTLP